MNIIIICISLIIIICIAGIFAYFTDIVTVTNHAKMGIIDIELKEYTLNDSGEKVQLNDIKYVLPGDTISRISEISCVDGSEDCYIRAKVEVKAKNTNLMKDENMIDLSNLNVDLKKWYYCSKDGYFYYKDILSDESENAILFTEVSIPRKWDNEWSLEEFSIDVTAEAIQSKNFTPDFSEDSEEPWPGITEDDIEKCIYPDHVKNN